MKRNGRKTSRDHHAVKSPRSPSAVPVPPGESRRRSGGAAAKGATQPDRGRDEGGDGAAGEPEQQDMQDRSADAPVTLEQLRQRFKTLKDAKFHYQVKAASWAVLLRTLNGSCGEDQSLPDPQQPDSLLSSGDRLAVLEQEVQSLHAKVDRLLALVSR